jgi:hypothetical protein
MTVASPCYLLSLLVIVVIVVLINLGVGEEMEGACCRCGKK